MTVGSLHSQDADERVGGAGRQPAALGLGKEHTTKKSKLDPRNHKQETPNKTRRNKNFIAKIPLL